MLRAVHLEPNPFDIERELVTPTFKLKRPQLLNYYKVLQAQLKYVLLLELLKFSDFTAIVDKVQHQKMVL